MKTNVQNIAQIRTGLFAKPMKDGQLVYLQAKHFDENGQLRINLHADLSPDSVTERHLLKPGEVLFSAKGTKNFATVYEDHNPPAVASTSFFVLSLLDSTIIPQYVAWFLNHPNTQTILKGQAIGTSIVSISKAVLESLEIWIPSIEVQQVVLEITKLRNREKHLKQQIEVLREKQIQQEIINAIKS